MGYMITRELTEKLHENVPGLMRKENVPGLSLTLLKNSEIFWIETFGLRNVFSGEIVTEDTIFEAASLSKPVFAYGVLKLCETGFLDLDIPLIDYLPEPYIPDEPRLKLLTMRHVLSHTTGFPNWRPDGKELKMYFTPGERFSYSGEGYMYLQAVVTQVMDQNPAELMVSNLLQPLGMKNSCFVLNDQSDLLIAVGHNEKGEAQEKQPWKEMYAAASLHCSSKDFGNFMCAVMRPSQDIPLQLSPEMTEEMLTPQVQVNDSPPWSEDWPKSEFKISDLVSWGLGWGIQHTSTGDSIWHWGDNGNYRAFAVGYPAEGCGLVIMTNGKNGQRVINHILRDIVGGEYPGLDWLYS
jgi:CubicO group peptidase (beta-lactamase class C family)